MVLSLGYFDGDSGVVGGVSWTITLTEAELCRPLQKVTFDIFSQKITVGKVTFDIFSQKTTPKRNIRYF